MTISRFAQQISSQEKLLIIGCGDIGARLAQILNVEKYAITGIKRSPKPNLAYLNYQCCDATNEEALGKIIVNNFDIIVVTMVPSEFNEASYRLAYITTCQNLVSQLRRLERPPRLIIFVSSTAVYGQEDGNWVNERSVTQPKTYSGQCLLEAEAVIQQSGIPNTIVRFSGIYGPGRNRLINQVIQGRASGGSHITNRIHVQDCARVIAHLIALQPQCLAPLYLASDNLPTPMVEVITWIAAQLSLEEEFIASESENERGNKKISNKLLLDTGYQFLYPNFKSGYSELLQDYKHSKI